MNCMSSIGANTYTAIAMRTVDMEVNQLQRDVRYAFACTGLTRKPFLHDCHDFLDINPRDACINRTHNMSMHFLPKTYTHFIRVLSSALASIHQYGQNILIKNID